MHIIFWCLGTFFVLTSILGYTMTVDAPWWYRMFITPWFWYLWGIVMFFQWIGMKIEDSYRYGKIRKIMMAFGCKPYNISKIFNKTYR